MADVYAFNVIDRYLKDLCQTEKPFGEKVMIVSGDLRQFLLIVPKAKRPEISKICVKNSELWPKFCQYQLHEKY